MDAAIESARAAVGLPVGARVVAAMSGGVDSTVDRRPAAQGRLRRGRRHPAALRPRRGDPEEGRLLRRPGHPRRPHRRRDASASRTTSSTTKAASATQVIEDFADAYLRGETPIPCIRCNQTVKFRDLLDVARDLGAEAMATGHYVRRAVGADGAAAAPGRRSGARPDLLPVRHHAPSSSTTCASRWAACRSPRCARVAAELGLARRRQAGQPGHLLRAGGPLHHRDRPPAPARRARPATSCTWTAACWAATRASPATPSASAAA